MRFLVDHNVERERVGVAGYADQRPIVPNDSPANRATNRRVEFVFIRETPPAEEEAESGDANTEAELAEGAGDDPEAASLEPDQELDQLDQELEQEPATAGL